MEMGKGSNGRNEGSRIRLIFGYGWKYTLAFFIFGLFVLRPFWSTGTGFVYFGDGFRQHYLVMMYIGKWLRGIAVSLFTGHKLSVPLFDFSIGYGADIPSTFAYYGFGDPLLLLSAFVPAHLTEYLYEALILIRLYLAGVAFSVFCLSMKKGQAGTLAGAMAYTFCMYALHGGIRHPFFLNPMICFPLLLLGVERILQKKKPALFMVMVCVTMLSNFYFFYMAVIGTVLYVFFRFFTLVRGSFTDVLKEFFRCVLRFLLYGSIGVAMGMIIFLPIVFLFTDTLRAQSELEMASVYSARYYAKFLKSFVFGRGTDNYTLLGYAWPAIPAIILLFLKTIRYDFLAIRTKQNKEEMSGGTSGMRAAETAEELAVPGGNKARVSTALSLAFVLLTVMLLFPVFGKIFNGFSYVSNRWCWIYSALVCWILVYEWDDMTHLFQKRKAVYAAVLAVVFSTMCLHLAHNSHMKFDKEGSNVISTFLPFGSVYGKLQRNTLEKIKKQKKTDKENGEGFWRHEVSFYSMKNEAVIAGYHGVQYYWSLAPGAPSRYLLELGMSIKNPFNYSGLNSRTFTDALASVRYYASDTGFAPYGFEEIPGEAGKDGKYRLYKNKYALPLGYTYDHYLPWETFEALDPLARSQSLLQGILLEGRDLDTAGKELPELTPCSPVTDAEKISCELEPVERVTIKKSNQFKCSRRKAVFKLRFDGRENCETYLYIKNLRVKRKKKLKKIEMTIQAKSKTKVLCLTEKSRYFYGKNDLLVNLGYHKEALKELQAVMTSSGTYSYDEMVILCQPMDQYVQDVEKLRQDVFSDEIGTNRVWGHITLEKPKILCLSVPWSRGWTARVDGEKVRLLKANIMYMAIPLTRGSHEIELSYITPGLIPGAVINLLGIILFVAVGFRKKKDKEKEKSISIL